MTHDANAVRDRPSPPPLTVAVVGSVLADVVVQIPHLPQRGQNLYVPHLAVSPGGKGTNAAVTLVRHGVEVHAVSNLGDDVLGAHVRAELEAAGLGTDQIGVDPSSSTGVVIVFAEPGGEPTYVAYPAASRTVTPADVRQRLGPLLPQLDGLLFNLEAPEEALLAAIEMAEAQDVPIFVDAGPERAYTPRLWSNAAVLSPNQAEAAALVGYPLGGVAGAERAARDLLRQGAEAVVIKLGADGAFWATADDAGHIPAFPVEAVDTAGAGDAFTAGLVWALLSERPLQQAVRWANACGALVATRFGTMPIMPTRKEVAGFLDDLRDQ